MRQFSVPGEILPGAAVGDVFAAGAAGDDIVRAEHDPAAILVLHQQEVAVHVVHRSRVVPDVGQVGENVDRLLHHKGVEGAGAVGQNPLDARILPRVALQVLLVLGVGHSGLLGQMQGDRQPHIVGDFDQMLGQIVANAGIGRIRSKGAIRLEPQKPVFLHLAGHVLGRHVGRHRHVHRRLRIGRQLLGHPAVVPLHIHADHWRAQHQVVHLPPGVQIRGPVQLGLVVERGPQRSDVPFGSVRRRPNVGVHVVDRRGHERLQLLLPDLPVEAYVFETSHVKSPM